MSSLSFWLRVFLIGGIGGLLCDQIHVQLGVLYYPRPDFLGQAWWVAPNFGIGVVLMMLGSAPFAAKLEELAPRPGTRTLAVQAAWFLGAYFLSGLMKDRPIELLAIYAVAFAGRLFVARKTGAPWIAAYAAVLAIGGPVYEGLLSSTGAFVYARHPDLLLPVPEWLPGLYAHGAPLALSIARLVSLPARTEKIRSAFG